MCFTRNLIKVICKMRLLNYPCRLLNYYLQNIIMSFSVIILLGHPSICSKSDREKDMDSETNLSSEPREPYTAVKSESNLKKSLLRHSARPQSYQLGNS